MPNESCRELIISQGTAEFFVQFNGDVEQLQNETGADCVQIINERYAVVYYALNDIERVQTEVTDYSAVPKLFGLLDVQSAEAIGVNRIRRQTSLNLLGQGVLIGFLDTGIDYTHPAFINADNTTRIVSIWDQTIQTGRNPTGFAYGSEFDSEKINAALLTEQPFDLAATNDTDGHGTAMAGIAAGNIETTEGFTGMAPLSGIVMVKLKQAKEYLKQYFCLQTESPCFQETDIALGIQYLLSVARRESKPMVVCLGIGTGLKSHEGFGIVDELIDSLSGRTGLCSVTAVGNEAIAASHYRGGLGFRETNNNLYEDIQIRVAAGEPGFTFSLWGSAPSLYSVAVISPSGEYTSPFPPRVDYSSVVSFFFEATTLYVDYEIVEQRSGDQLILLRFCTPTEGIWTVRVFYTETNFSFFDCWLPIRPFLMEGTGFLLPDPDVTICDPANALHTISVAGENYQNNSIYVNSSRGFTRLGRVKPDIAAPCVDILVPAVGGGYTRRTGTSLAAAHTAGVCALMLEYGIVRGRRLYLNGIEIKKILIKGAQRTIGDYPNREFGWGTLDIYEALDSLRTVL